MYDAAISMWPATPWRGIADDSVFGTLEVGTLSVSWSNSERTTAPDVQSASVNCLGTQLRLAVQSSLVLRG
jgi:hypothetical protein